MLLSILSPLWVHPAAGILCVSCPSALPPPPPRHGLRTTRDSDTGHRPTRVQSGSHMEGPDTQIGSTLLQTAIQTMYI